MPRAHESTRFDGTGATGGRRVPFLDDSVPVVNRFASGVDGSPYELTAGDDSDSVAKWLTWLGG